MRGVANNIAVGLTPLPALYTWEVARIRERAGTPAEVSDDLRVAWLRDVFAFPACLAAWRFVSEPGGRGRSRLESLRNLAIPGPAAQGGVGLRVVDSGELVLAGPIFQ